MIYGEWVSIIEWGVVLRAGLDEDWGGDTKVVMAVHLMLESWMPKCRWTRKAIKGVGIEDRVYVDE